MEKQLLIYSKVVPVSKAVHGSFSLKGTGDLSFAAGINSIPLTLPEVPLASAEYPVVFAGGDGRMVPVIVTGLQDGQNLVLNSENKWQGRYVPAFLRRYPFVFSKPEGSDTFTLCVDESYSGWNEEGNGERLFDASGEQTQYLKGVLNFLQEYQAMYNQTQSFCDRLVELDLLEAVTANFEFAGSARTSLGGFYAVNREKLKGLSDELLLQMFKRDELELIYLHLFSLSRFNRLVEMMAEEEAGIQH